MEKKEKKIIKFRNPGYGRCHRQAIAAQIQHCFEPPVSDKCLTHKPNKQNLKNVTTQAV